MSAATWTVVVFPSLAALYVLVALGCALAARRDPSIPSTFSSSTTESETP